MKEFSEQINLNIVTNTLPSSNSSKFFLNGPAEEKSVHPLMSIESTQNENGGILNNSISNSNSSFKKSVCNN